MTLRTILILCAIAIIIIPDAIFLIRKKKKTDELFDYMKKGEFEEFYRVVDSKECQYLFQSYNRENYKLVVALSQKNEKKIKEQIASIEKLKLTKQQKFEFYNQIFSYYISKEDSSKAQMCIDNIRSFGDEQLAKKMEMIYDVEIKHGYSYLDEMLKQEETASEQDKLDILIMIERMYQNKGDKEKIEEYRKKLDEIINSPVEKKK